MIYYVSTNGNDGALGTKEAPFKTINHAAQVAVAGDTVRVFGGVYRERVCPKNSGEENARIVYEAVEGETPVIKGSEVAADWEKVEGTVWKKVFPNSFFGDFNPYTIALFGDWYRVPHEKGYDVHLGDVYIDGRSMFEASSKEDLFEASVRYKGMYAGDPFCPAPMVLAAESVYRWYAEVDENNTVIYGNFQDKDPNACLVEINVRPACFYPDKLHVNYITVRGFEMAHAATQWAPPTASQIGMIGPRWSKGWIIENNHLHDSKCCAVSIGRDALEGENLSQKYCRKSGHIYQLEATYEALKEGWSKETVGSHIVRNNEIHDCGQCGVVGNLGCVFSRIEHNNIYNIARKQEFWGHELGGIKLHSPIDVVIEDNYIHQCSTFGTWIDWQDQGLRITKNVYFDNIGDLKVEVSHGPCTIDNNLFLSQYSLINHAQGTAYVNNIFAGYVYPLEHRNRATPYHYPHSTFPKGYAVMLGGDDRVFGNIIIGASQMPPRTAYFSSYYNKYMTCEQYFQSNGSNRYFGNAEEDARPQPVYIEENVYVGFAKPFRAEKDALVADNASFSLEEVNGETVFTFNVSEDVANKRITPVTTERLGSPRIVEQAFEDPNGEPLDFSYDVAGNKRGDDVFAGPFAYLSAGENKFVVWKK